MPVDFDKYGHCVVCHKNMLIEEIIDNKVQRRFTPEYAETEYLLDDGSRMRVAICQDCKNHLSEKDENKIMDCVIKGWEVEVNSFKHWSDEKKTKYLDTYSKKKIVCSSEDISKDILDNKLEVYKAKKKEE